MTQTISRKHKEKARRNNLMLIGVVAVAAVLLVALVVWANASTGESATTLDQCGKPECGKANAPATVEIFSDFQ